MNRKRVILILLIVAFVFGQHCSNRKVSFANFYEHFESIFIESLTFVYQNFDDLRKQDCKALSQRFNDFSKAKGTTENPVFSNKFFIRNAQSGLCGYSSPYHGHTDKPLFDTTIYPLYSQVDTTFAFQNDSIHYEVTIRKTMLYFKSRSIKAELELDIRIPDDVKASELLSPDTFNRERVRFQIKQIMKN